jgi:hypothetical protein
MTGFHAGSFIGDEDHAASGMYEKPAQSILLYLLT